MTIGYPDSQSYAQWRGENVWAKGSGPFAPGLTSMGAQLVASWRGVHLRVIPAAGQARVTLQWFLDAGETQGLGSDQWGVNTNTGLNVKVASKGPYCDLTINNTGIGNFTGTIQVVPSNAITKAFEYCVTNNWFNSGTVSVPLSGTSDQVLPFIQAGLAKVSIQYSDTSGKLTISVARYLESGLFNDQLVHYDAGTASVQDLVGLPDDIAGIHVVNTDATAAHSYAVRLVAGLGQS